MSEGLLIYVLIFIFYGIALIPIERLTNSVIQHQNDLCMVRYEPSHSQSLTNLDASNLRMACMNILVDSE